MTSMLRLGLMSVFALSLTATASAADLAGDWELSFPTDPTAWTFTQDGADFTATTGEISGLPPSQYDITGVTYGRWYAGVVYFSMPGTPYTNIPVGAMAGSVSGDSLTGRLASYLLGVTPVTGQRVN